MAPVNQSGFGSLGKAITDIFATSLHHALQLVVPRFHDERDERTHRTAESAVNAAGDLLGPVWGRIHEQLDPAHPLHPIVGVLARKPKD